jgi:ribosomal protein S18 acetylase RimI-like enzyme
MSSSLEDSLCDPVTLEVMVNAMSLPCGHSFSQKTIDEWLASKSTCPLCNAATTRESLRPNFAIRGVIESLSSSAPIEPRELAASSGSAPPAPPPVVDAYVESLVLQTVTADDEVMVRRVADMMATAFVQSDDIFVGYCWPNRSPSAVKWFFGVIVDYCAREGKLHVLVDPNGGRIVASALWQHPQAPGESGVSIFSMLKSGLLLSPFVIGIRSTARVLKSLRSTEETHELTMGAVPHWSLYSVAVADGLRCRGIGSRLMAPVCASADKTGHACYVDTATPRTEAFFERLGFVATSKLCGLKDGVPPFTVLVRQPTEQKNV